VSTESNRAVRWTVGVEAFGVALTSQSGFSKNVKLSYRFGGSGRKVHRVCGTDGKQAIWQSGRAFSGTRR
jgi:hypothetical protein